MSTEERIEEGQTRYSTFWPLMLISVSVIVLLIYQLLFILSQRNALVSQIDLKRDDDAKAKKIIESVEPALNRLVNDLAVLSDTDSEAKAILNKYGFRRTTNAPAPAPAAKQ